MGGLRRLGFGISKMLGVGDVEETKQPPGSQQLASKDKERADSPRGTRVIDTSSMSPSEVAFQRERMLKMGLTPIFVDQ